VRTLKDLEAELKEQVVILCEKAIEQADIERYEASNRTFGKILELLPEPKNEWKAYTWMQASVADNCYELKDYTVALALLDEVIELDEQYQENGFVRMRRGQCQCEVHGDESGVDELKLAHSLGGDEIFEEEYAKYKKLATQP